MSKMLNAAARFDYVGESRVAQEVREHAMAQRKKYGVRRPHGHYPTDVVTVGGTDYAVLPVSGTVYRIRWHEKVDRRKGTSYFVPQFLKATRAERQAVEAKRLPRAA